MKEVKGKQEKEKWEMHLRYNPSNSLSLDFGRPLKQVKNGGLNMLKYSRNEGVDYHYKPGYPKKSNIRSICFS